MRDDDDVDDSMETWSEEKLKEVVEKKHGESNKKMPTTEIVSVVLEYDRKLSSNSSPDEYLSPDL